MGFTEGLRNAWLDGTTINAVRLHSGAPGDGTANALGAGLSAAVFGAAAAGARPLTADVTVTGLAASQAVTHVSFWTTAGAVFLGSEVVAGDATANVAGEYTVKAATTKAVIT